MVMDSLVFCIGTNLFLIEKKVEYPSKNGVFPGQAYYNPL